MSWKFWLAVVVGYSIIAAVLYAPSLGGPWQYDDYAQILDQKVLTSRDLWKLLPSLFRFTAWPDGWTGTRDFVRATFWLNWKWWALEPLGYRIVNLGIHVGNAMLVTVLLRQLLRGTTSTTSTTGGTSTTEKLGNEARDTRGTFETRGTFWIAVFGGLLFLIHPVQSQAVAYVAQRFTSVATMGYLGAVVAFIKSTKSTTSIRSTTGKSENEVRGTRGTFATRGTWYVVALLSALLAYNSKEITITLPVVLTLILIARRSSSTGRTGRVTPRLLPVLRALLVLPFFILALKIPLQVVSASTTNLTADPQKIPGIIVASVSIEQKNPPPTRLEYFLTEQNVMRTYLRLLVLPIKQTLDYDYQITKKWDAPTAASGFLHLVLIGVGGWLLMKGTKSTTSSTGTTGKLGNKTRDTFGTRGTRGTSLIGLGILWFYVTVGIESSVIAIPDVIYEHRVYLPFVGFVLVVVGVINEYFRFKISDLRFGRNPSFGLFYVLLATCFVLLAVATFRRAVVWGNEVRLWKDVYEKAPEKPRAVKNYGVVLAASGKYDEGIKHLLRAVELDPDNADYWSNLGTAYLRSQRFDEASGRFKRAYELAMAEALAKNTPPAKETAQYMSDYGVTLVQLKRGEDAKPAFERALELNPELYAARLGLGAAKNLLGNLDGAASDFRRLTEEHPDQSDAFGNLATILTKQEKFQEALSVLLKLKKLHPSYEGIDSRIATVNRMLIQGSGSQ